MQKSRFAEALIVSILKQGEAGVPIARSCGSTTSVRRRTFRPLGTHSFPPRPWDVHETGSTSHFPTGAAAWI